MTGTGGGGGGSADGNGHTTAMLNGAGGSGVVLIRFNPLVKPIFKWNLKLNGADVGVVLAQLWR